MSPASSASFASSEQARTAGSVGARVNQCRARLRRHLQSGSMRPQPFIALPPQWLQTAEVRFVVEAVRGIGPHRAERIYARAGLHGRERLGTLAPALRRALVLELDEALPRMAAA